MVAPIVLLSTQEQSYTGRPLRRPSGCLHNAVQGLVKKSGHWRKKWREAAKENLSKHGIKEG